MITLLFPKLTKIKGFRGLTTQMNHLAERNLSAASKK
jgi:hypothetical protein